MYQAVLLLFGALISVFVGMLAASLVSTLSNLFVAPRTYIHRRFRDYVSVQSERHLLWLLDNRPDLFFVEYQESLGHGHTKYRLTEAEIQLAQTFRGRCKLVFDADFFMQGFWMLTINLVNYFVVARVHAVPTTLSLLLSLEFLGVSSGVALVTWPTVSNLRSRQKQ